MANTTYEIEYKDGEFGGRAANLTSLSAAREIVAGLETEGVTEIKLLRVFREVVKSKDRI